MKSRLFWSILCVLTATSRLNADHSQLLQREFRRAISRHLACDSEGYCYLLLPTPKSDGTGFTLKVSRSPHPQSIADFPIGVPLPARPGTSVFSAGIAVDGEDRLHIAWSTNEGRTAYSMSPVSTLRSAKDSPKWRNPANGRGTQLVLAAERTWIGDICRAPNGRVWLAWLTSKPDDSKRSIYLGTVRGGSWQAITLGGGPKFYPPAVFFSKGGAEFHVACSDTVGGTHFVQGRVSELAAKQQAWSFQRTHAGHRPALAETARGLLAVHESGDSIKYTLLSDAPKSHPLTDLDSRLVWDTVHSPRMVNDHHGVPWMFFIDSTRQHVFYSRWLGTGWSPIMNGFWLTRNTARFEDNHLSIDWLGIEQGLGSDKSAIGVSIGHRSQFPAAKLQVLPVPSLKSDRGRKVLFFDLQEVQYMDGVDLHVNTARKRPEPILSAGRRGDFDSQGAANIAVVKQEGVYRAWYSGLHRERGSKWPQSGPIPLVRIGYAESRDGVRFQKKPLGLASFGRNDNTNIVGGLPATPIYRPIVPTGMHIDRFEPDPMRRYKFLTWTGGRPDRASNVGGETDAQTWTLWTSPDGLRWREASRGGIRYPGGMPSSFSPQSLFHDADESDPERRYKAYGFLGLNNDRRGAGYGYSADAVEWTAHPSNPVFDPWARATPVVRNGKVHQIHDAVVWKYHQYYLALYQYQRSGEDMTIELAMSRDGQTFTYIQPGSEVVRRGAAGEWDADSISPCVPLMDEDEIKVYYSGYRFSETERIEGERACGLAVLRLDGFTHLSLDDEQSEGSVTTIPVNRGSATDLVVNAFCLQDSQLSVELVDEAGRPFPGYSRGECVPLTSDSLEHRVRWKERRFADVPNDRFRIRFHFAKGTNSPKLYSFSFRRR